MIRLWPDGNGLLSFYTSCVLAAGPLDPPRWYLPATAVCVVGVALLAWVDFCTCSPEGWQTRALAVTLVVIVWGIELAGFRWPCASRRYC
jgi:hypothetical protein